MNEEAYEEVFLKDPEFIHLIEEKTAKVEEMAGKHIKKEYKKCVMPEFVDLECLKRKEERLLTIAYCTSNSLLEMCFGYKECVQSCLDQKNGRVYCFDNCKNLMMKTFAEADYDKLAKLCVEKNFAD